jgi:hypothetical protein
MHGRADGTMTPPRAPQPRQVRYSAKHQARLDAKTHATLETLAKTSQRKRGPILRYVMQGGLRHSAGWTIDRSPVVAVPPVPIVLEPELYQQVQDAAAAHGVSMAAWLREAMRRITVDDFPASRCIGERAAARMSRAITIGSLGCGNVAQAGDIDAHLRASGGRGHSPARQAGQTRGVPEELALGRRRTAPARDAGGRGRSMNG